MCGSVLLLVARPFRTSLAPVPEAVEAVEAVEHVGARRVPGPLEDLGRETTDRDRSSRSTALARGMRSPTGRAAPGAAL
jgi:hypothetical protein